MPHHVIVSLPDGRVIRVDYRIGPIVSIIRKIHDEIQKPPERRDHDRLCELDLRAAAWLDANGHLCCTAEQVRDGTCTLHGEVT